MRAARGPPNYVAEFRPPAGPREAGREPREPNRERSRRPFGGDVADQGPPPGLQVSLDLAEHADAGVRLRDVTVAEPGEGKHVKAPRKRDGLDRARVELRRETFLFEDATSQGDGARADVEALDAIPELEQRDQIAPRAAPDHENPILDLQKAIIQSALPGHQARADQVFAATELLPGVDDRSPQALESQRSRSEMRQGAAGELESPGGAPEKGVQSLAPAAHHLGMIQRQRIMALEGAGEIRSLSPFPVAVVCAIMPSVVELSIGIAGLRTAVVTRDSDVASIVRDRYEGFLSTGPADWRIQISPPSGGVPFSKDVVVRRDGGPARFSVRRHDFAGTEIGRASCRERG